MSGRSTEPLCFPFEEWRAVSGTEGRYEVSSLGRVRRSTSKYSQGRILKPGRSHGGYLFITLSVRNRQRPVKVHRLVAEAFLGPRPPDRTTNHKDGDKRNNAAANLEYVTPKENTRHAVGLGLIDFIALGKNTAKVDRAAIVAIRSAEGVLQRDLALHFGVSQATISAIRTGKRHADVA